VRDVNKAAEASPLRVATTAGDSDAIATIRMAAMSKNRPPPPAARSPGRRLDQLLRQALQQAPWSRVRGMIESGKVRVAGQIVTDPGFQVPPGADLEVVPNAPRPATRDRLPGDAIVSVDDQVVVVRKPAGVSAVPFEPGERGTLQEQVRAWLNRTARSRGDRATGDLGIVHRIDKETSGLLVFTRTLAAKRHLAQQFRFHTVERLYFALAHGDVPRASFHSRIARDRGDGLRGSARGNEGQDAITHVEPVERLGAATLVKCRLETGRTHQIRIHLSEAGHPVLGERVYIRNFRGPQLPAPRLMLHAAVLGFEHPTRHEHVRFEEPMPADMLEVIESLHKGKAP
jgi:23S rRNA pseudouridine1911/1915/1917 synthase